MNPDVNSIIEDAKKRGVDMSWLHAPAPAGQTPEMGAVQRVSPGASQLMQAAQQAQANKPAYMPFPGGTPTQARRQADEASRQFELGHKFDREQFDWRRDTDVRDFDADQAYRQQQIDLQKAAAAAKAGGGGSGAYGADGIYNPFTRLPYLSTQQQQDDYLRTIASNEVYGLAEHALRGGGSYKDVYNVLTSREGREMLAAHRVVDDLVIREIALESMAKYIESNRAARHWSDPIQQFNNIDKMQADYDKAMSEYNKLKEQRIREQAEQDKLKKGITNPSSDPNIVETATGYYNIATGETIPK